MLCNLASIVTVPPQVVNGGVLRITICACYVVLKLKFFFQER
jgi:hypothetical protein